MNHLQDLISQKEIFIKFMKEKYPLFKNSNVFLRDIQYAIKSYFEKKDQFLTYAQTDKISLGFIQNLEETKEFINVSKNTWKVNFSFEKVVKENEPVQN
ncbi:MAG: hypothetical protein AB1521_10300 [Bacteroidota bacterium]